ncbi:aldose 1-epimerase family protein [Ciceribacter sp. L1K22]|uniref:aldose 1-epimerase family protein n=1 Tax=Ciceribacter sp. L1K22 TaxID=2820275 RepID=UPI001ABE61BE|nr:aldose 1-epimerase family protein [Ciceribacter sp. L1K22]MBO3760887.1 aldose 1-epimerase family protein [Ciceribacter sp. L1K22]
MDFKAAKGPRLSLDPTSVLDIRSCVVDGVDLSPGRAIPDDGDPRIDHSLEGFLFTCGPDHIRHPEPISGKDGANYPLHGSFSSRPADILDVSLEDDADCRARVPVDLADGGKALLTRHWRIDGANGEVHLRDTLCNAGETPFPAMLMYHMNIGSKHLDEATRISGAMIKEGSLGWRFGDPAGQVFCVPAGKGGWAEVRLGPIAAIGGRTLIVRFRTDTLPFLQMWHNQSAPAAVLGIEPVSHRWVGRAELEKAGELDLLAPGETREYALTFAFV